MQVLAEKLPEQENFLLVSGCVLWPQRRRKMDGQNRDAASGILKTYVGDLVQKFSAFARHSEVGSSNFVENKTSQTGAPGENFMRAR